MTHLRGATEQYAESGYARSTSGEEMVSVSFDFIVEPSPLSRVYDFPVVPDGYEHVIQCVTISTLEDEFVHWVGLAKRSDMEFFFAINFINGGIFDFPGHVIPAGDNLAMEIFNEGEGNIRFWGVVNWVSRYVGVAGECED